MTSRNRSPSSGQTRRRRDSQDDTREQDRQEDNRRPERHDDNLSPVALARRTAGELAELLGREPEAITSLERTDDGWRVGMEVLEIRRIPDTADVLAEYEVDADEHGHLTSYRRGRRYTRGHVDEDR